MADGREASIAPRNYELGPSCPRNCLSRAAMSVVPFSHHHDVLGKRLILDSTDRENHFLSRFENATVHNVGRNEGNLGTVRAIDNSNPCASAADGLAPTQKTEGDTTDRGSARTMLFWPLPWAGNTVVKRA